MKDLFVSLQAKLQPLVSYVDEDWGQLNDYGNLMPVKFPCCLLDFEDITYSDLGTDRNATPQNRQTATGSIRLVIAYQKLTNSSGMAPINQKNQAFEIYNAVQQIHNVLHGWKPLTNTGALIRTRMRRVSNDNGLQVVAITYSFSQSNV